MARETPSSLHYLWRVDRHALAREHRRQRVLDALEFEQGREVALLEQIGDLVAEEEGPHVDREAFSKMSPEDVAIVSDVLADGSEPGSQGENEHLEPDLTFPDAEEEEEDAGIEIARLEQELSSCRRRQRAFERYLEALGSDG